MFWVFLFSKNSILKTMFSYAIMTLGTNANRKYKLIKTQSAGKGDMP